MRKNAKANRMCAIGAAMEAQERLRLPIDAYATARNFLDKATEKLTADGAVRESADVVDYNDVLAGDVHDVKKVFIAARKMVDKELEETT